MTDARLQRAGLVLCLLGLGVAGYLTVVHYAGGSPVCEVAHGCETVQKSDYAKLAGVPVALLGLAGYAALAAALVARGEAALVAAAGLALGGFAFSAYLTYREVFTIEAICIWCVASAAIFTFLAPLCVARLLRAAPREASRAPSPRTWSPGTRRSPRDRPRGPGPTA